MKETSSPLRGYLYGLVVALVWGAQPVVATFGYRAGLNAFDLTLLRFTASGLLMLPLFLRRDPLHAGGLGWRRAAVFMLLAGPLYNAVLIGGLTWAPSSHSSLIYPAFTPVFTALLAKWMLDRRERIWYPVCSPSSSARCCIRPPGLRRMPGAATCCSSARHSCGRSTRF
jgi:drug/metabolite transporter (DMT)-like permease